jgi:hypothetical protein
MNQQPEHSEQKLKMRTREEILQAHTNLCVIIDRAFFASQDDARRAKFSLDVLCWVLCHEGGDSFGKGLDTLVQILKALPPGIQAVVQTVSASEEQPQPDPEPKTVVH